MKITNELLNSQIKNNKKDTLATRLSIFLAVVLFGTIIFIFGTIKADQYNLILSTVGDYNVSFTQVDRNMLKSIMVASKSVEINLSKETLFISSLSIIDLSIFLSTCVKETL